MHCSRQLHNLFRIVPAAAMRAQPFASAPGGVFYPTSAPRPLELPSVSATASHSASASAVPVLPPHITLPPPGPASGHGAADAAGSGGLCAAGIADPRAMATPQALALLEACLTLRPKARPSAAALLGHAFFTQEEPVLPTQRQAAEMLRAAFGDCGELHELAAKTAARAKGVRK